MIIAVERSLNALPPSYLSRPPAQDRPSGPILAVSCVPDGPGRSQHGHRRTLTGGNGNVRSLVDHKAGRPARRPAASHRLSCSASGSVGGNRYTRFIARAAFIDTSVITTADSRKRTKEQEGECEKEGKGRGKGYADRLMRSH